MVRGVVALAALAVGLPATLGAQMAAAGVRHLAMAEVPACTDSITLRLASEQPAAVRSPRPRVMIAPPLEPAPPASGRIAVEFFLDARGVVDSVRLEGVGDPRYLEVMRRQMLEHTFWPAVFRDCAVPSRAAIAFTFP